MANNLVFVKKWRAVKFLDSIEGCKGFEFFKTGNTRKDGTEVEGFELELADGEILSGWLGKSYLVRDKSDSHKGSEQVIAKVHPQDNKDDMFLLLFYPSDRETRLVDPRS